MTAGCHSDSINPITENIKPLSDNDAILGVWCIKDKTSETNYLHIGKDRKNNIRLIILSHRNGELRDVMSFIGHKSSVGDQDILNLKSVSIVYAEGISKLFDRYMFYKYHIDDNNLLNIYALDQSVINGVRSKIKTEVYGKNTIGEKVVITDSSENIYKLINSKEYNIFSERKATFGKMGEGETGCYQSKDEEDKSSK